MKKIICTFISFALAVAFFFTMAFPFNIVSADAVPVPFSVPYFYDSTVTAETYESLKTALNSLFERCGLDSDDYYLFHRMLNQNHFIYVFDKQGTFKNLTYSSAQYINFHSNRYSVINTQSLGSINSLTFYDNANSYVPFLLSYNNTDQFYTVTQISNYGNDNTFFNPPQNYTGSIFISDLNYIPSFVRDDYTLYGLNLAINETSFYDWIIENNKLSELPSYITQSKLLSFIQFYSDFGGSFTNFLKNIPDWFNHMNIINQSKDNVNILKTSMDKLYQEYFNSFWVEIGKHSAETLPHHRRNIQTQTTDDDTTLITDDQNDTLIESLLRDILRGIIQISNQIGDGVKSIIDKLSQLNFTTTVVNNGGNNDTDTDVEGIDSDISDTMADSIEDVPTLDTEVPNLLSAPAVVGSTVNIYLNVFESMGLDKILIFAVTVSFLIIKIRGNTK